MPKLTILLLLCFPLVTVCAEENENSTDDERPYEALLEYDLDISNIDFKVKAPTDEDSDKTPKQKVLESKARDHTDRAISLRNYVEPVDEEILSQKQYINEDYSRANGQALLDGKRGSEKSDNTNLEKGLMSSFDKKKSKNKRIEISKIEKGSQTDKNKKGDGNSPQYRSQAGSLSDAFKKK